MIESEVGLGREAELLELWWPYGSSEEVTLELRGEGGVSRADV